MEKKFNVTHYIIHHVVCLLRRLRPYPTPSLPVKNNAKTLRSDYIYFLRHSQCVQLLCGGTGLLYKHYMLDRTKNNFPTINHQPPNNLLFPLHYALILAFPCFMYAPLFYPQCFQGKTFSSRTHTKYQLHFSYYLIRPRRNNLSKPNALGCNRFLGSYLHFQSIQFIKSNYGERILCSYVEVECRCSLQVYSIGVDSRNGDAQGSSSA